MRGQIRALGIDGDRHIGGRRIAGRIGFLDRDRHRTIRQLQVRRHRPLAIGTHRRGQNFIGTRHGHFDRSARLTRAADGRGLVIGNAITRLAAIGSRVKLRRQARALGINGYRNRGAGRVTRGIGFLDRNIDLAVRQRSRRSHRPFTVWRHRRGQHFSRARNRHFNRRTRLTGTAKGRLVNIGQAIALESAVGASIQPSRQGRGGCIQNLCRLGNRSNGRARRRKLVGERINRLDHTQEFNKAVTFVATLTGLTSSRRFLIQQVIQIATIGQRLGNLLETLFVVADRAVGHVRFDRRRHFHINPSHLTRLNRHLAPIGQLHDYLRTIGGDNRLAFTNHVPQLEATHFPGCITGESFTGKSGNFGNCLTLGHGFLQTRLLISAV